MVVLLAGAVAETVETGAMDATDTTVAVWRS
jgi:hypothetical protein